MPTNSDHKRAAFTLVELLVVISIIGVLIALLLPAVQSARESARRLSCTSKMKNIALAVLNHHDVEGHFPVSMGFVQGADGDEGAGPAVGWIVQIFPQLEQQPLYDRFEQGGAFNGVYQIGRGLAPAPGFGLGSNENGISVPDLMATQLDILQCPSDADASQLSTEQFGWPMTPVALTSYKGVIGDTVVDSVPAVSSFVNSGSLYPSGQYSQAPTFTTQNDCHRDTRCRGIFFRQSWRKPIRIARITDGTSNTLMIGEDVVRLNLHSAAYYSDGDWCSCNIPLNNQIGVPVNFVDTDTWWDHRGFKSLHPGGVNFARADGSVQLVNETVDNVLYRTSCTRNLGELVGENF